MIAATQGGNTRLHPSLTLHNAALGATLLLPFFLFYGRAIADILVVVTGLLFLAHSAIARDWRWVKRPWVQLAFLLWLIQLAGSAATGSTHAILQSLAVLRLFLFAAALEAWVLPPATARRALWMIFLILAVWVGLECWEQYLTGTNLFGDPRWGDGALTGPFLKPRAGGAFLLVSIPAFLPMIARTLQRRTVRSFIQGALSLTLLLATMILIGQRMPTLLLVLGLALTGLLLPILRRPLLIALAVGIAALVALPVISPPTYAKLVVKFLDQMSHFPDSPYGQLYVRAAVMTGMNPWIGLGFDGFRSFCPDPIYFHDLPQLGITNSIGGVSACNFHPHNYYLEVSVMAGLTGLFLFVAIAALWLARMIRALRPTTNPDQAMLFVTTALILWPFASTASLFTFDTAGWVFLLAGWALAASQQQNAVIASRESGVAIQGQHDAPTTPTHYEHGTTKTHLSPAP